MRKLTFTLCLGLCLNAQLLAQIVNVENLRLRPDSLGLDGLVNFNFTLVQNTQALFTSNTDLAALYRWPKRSLMALGNLALSFGDDRSFEQNGFIHFRYDEQISKRLVIEGFTQYQVDLPLRIQYRFLTGIGPRFRLLETEKQKFYTGHLVMGELDKELDNNILHSDFRLSSYLVYRIKLGDQLNAVTTLYYQPRFDKWEDFRTSLQSQLLFRILRNLQFNFSASLSYDAFPVEDPDIPNLTFKFTNGIIWRF